MSMSDIDYHGCRTKLSKQFHHNGGVANISHAYCAQVVITKLSEYSIFYNSYQLIKFELHVFELNSDVLYYITHHKKIRVCDKSN